VLIGTNAIVLKGVSIGDNSVIGAGSVVTKSIPANCIAAGNPCRVIRELMHEELSEVIRPNSHNDTIR
jgi:maltose O-acetyltransferase